MYGIKTGDFDLYCNMEMVELSLIEDSATRKELHELIRKHYHYTGSHLAGKMLDNWDKQVDEFIRIVPIEYKKVLQEEQMKKLQQKLRRCSEIIKLIFFDIRHLNIMGNPRAFLTIHRQEAGYRPVEDRIDDFSEVEQTLNSSDRRRQASRCMNCGVPFCHWACPLGNKQPEWQDFLYKGQWREAYHVLEQTCDFPEFTGRICPALCEKSCVLKLSCDEPVTIRENEVAIIEAAFREGLVQPVTPVRNGKRVAVIGSGPAGLTVANQLNRKGYEITVFEKDELPGGLLRFGIPNFKLSKNIIDRRIRLMEKEGIRFRVNTMVGKEILAKDIVKEYDAVCIAIGAETPRDLPIEGRNLKGVHFALELLGQQNRPFGRYRHPSQKHHQL